MVLTGIGELNRDAFANLLPEWEEEDSVEIGVIEDGKAVGAAVFSEHGDALFLQHLFVVPEYRRKGLATALLTGFFKELKDEPLKEVLVNFRDDAEGMEMFLLKQGFRLFTDAEILRAPAEEILHSKVARSLLKTTGKGKVLSISELLADERRAVARLLDEEKMETDLINDPELYEPLSFVIQDPDTGSLRSCVMCEKDGKEVTVLLLANVSHQPADLAELFRTMIRNANNEGLEDAELVFLSNREGIVETVEHLMDDPSKLKRDGYMFVGRMRLREEDYWLRDFILKEREGK